MNTQPPPSVDQIRRTIITALFSDDELYGRLVLKGGNALRLIYNLQSRTSLDIDMSMETDFADTDLYFALIIDKVKEKMSAIGIAVFDEKIEERPRNTTSPRWGGYAITFKLISMKLRDELSELAALRRNAIAFDSAQHRVWKIDISKYEHCEGKLSYDLDSQTIYVYSPEMIVIEKLRAICQQMPAYPLRGYPTPRARDFYDIYTVVNRLSVQLEKEDSAALAHAIFAAKDVPISLLRNIRNTRDYHFSDWPSVQVSESVGLMDFDHYFNFVANTAERLESVWKEHPPPF